MSAWRRHASTIALPGNDFLADRRPPVPLEPLHRQRRLVDGERSDDPAAALCASAFTAVWEHAVPYEDDKP